MTIRLTPDSERIPFRVFLTYENGYYLDISLYREVKNETTGQTIFQTYTVGKTGPLDGRVLHDPYETKDHLQYKRFTAKSNNTSYVYDFPEMFRQALLLIWKQYSERNKLKENSTPKDVFTSEELILDTKNQGKKNECFFLLSINYIF
jgi:acetyl-CoA carboxylase/biotin carboxylase 1